MTDREDDKPEGRYQIQDDSRTPPKGSPVHQTGDAEPVHGADNDPLIPPGYRRAP